MISILQAILLTVAGFFLMYLLALAVLSLFSKKRSSFDVRRTRKFAVVVPAHDEESTIGATVSSLKDLVYPRERFDVIVIADNCTDDTRHKALERGASVLVRENRDLRGKGYALRWCFDQIVGSDEGYDAVVVVDADCSASENLLSVFNWHLDQGSEAVQCADLIRPSPGSWTAEATRLGFLLYNYVRPMGRKVLGFHAGARGTGMCFSARILRDIPWNAFSQNEDLQYGLTLLLNGVRIDFAPEASVVSAVPTDPRNAESQRSRWEVGRYSVIRTYTTKLIRSSFDQRSLRPIDAVIDLLTPPFVNLMSFVLFMAVLNVPLVWFGIQGPETLLAWTTLLLAGLAYVIIGIIAVRDASLFSILFHVPKYALWKLILYVRLLMRGHTAEWVRTSRDDKGTSTP